MTSSIVTPRRITTRVARPSVTALVRRPRLVDPIAHHLKKGEGGARGASHRPRDHPRCYVDQCYHPPGVIGARAQAPPNPHSAYAAGSDLSQHRWPDVNPLVVPPARAAYLETQRIPEYSGGSGER